MVHLPLRRLRVIADYNCGFCRKLRDSLLQINDIEIREIPVGILGQDSRIKAASVLCDDDPVAKAESFYDRTAGTTIKTCTEGEEAVSQNIEWMQRSGLNGTPVIMDESGRILPGGAVPLPQIKAFLGIS